MKLVNELNLNEMKSELKESKMDPEIVKIQDFAQYFSVQQSADWIKGGIEPERAMAFKYRVDI